MSEPDGYLVEQLQQFVWAMVTKEHAWLEDRLRELRPGETWCQHEAQSDRSLPPVTWTRTFSGHVLPEGMLCSQRGARVQYGPAPDPWPPTECIPERGYHVTPHQGGGCFLR